MKSTVFPTALWRGGNAIRRRFTHAYVLGCALLQHSDRHAHGTRAALLTSDRRFTHCLEIAVHSVIAASVVTTRVNQTVETKRILVVDDHEDSATLMATALEMLGYEARTAFDGREGLEVAVDFRPDVVVIDLMLPNFDGWELATMLRQVSVFRNTRLIAISGSPPVQTPARAKAAGFERHLRKPVSMKSLAAVL